MTRPRAGGLLPDLSETFSGQVIARGLGLVTFLLLTRSLSPADYGRFTLALSVAHLAARLGDLGLDTALTHLLSRSAARADAGGGRALLSGVLAIRALAALAVFAAASALAPWIAGDLLRQPDLVAAVRLALLGIFAMAVQEFYLAWFAARLEFRRVAILGALGPAGVLLGVTATVLWGRLDVELAVAIHALLPLVGLLWAVRTLPPELTAPAAHARAAAGRALAFGRWIWASQALGSARYRLNAVLLARLTTLTEVGLYGFADKVASVVTLLSASLWAVLVPRTSRLEATELAGALRRYRRWLYLLPAALPLALLSGPAISRLAPGYEGAVPTFALLLASVLCSLAALPARTVLYSLGRPGIETLIELTALAVTFGLGLLLIPRWGAPGGAAAMLAQRLLSALVTDRAARHLAERRSGGGR